MDRRSFIREAEFGVCNQVLGKSAANRVHLIGVEIDMHKSRYVVVNQESRWKIVQSGRRFPEAYSSKSAATCSAIALATSDGHAGVQAEVLVLHEDGYFITEWIYGRDVRAEASCVVLSPTH